MVLSRIQDYARLRRLPLDPVIVEQVEYFHFHGQNLHLKPTQRIAFRLRAGGAVGGSEFPCYHPDEWQQWEDLVRRTLVGRDACEVNVIWDELFQAGMPHRLLAAVDIAIWDLVGRAMEKPVHAMLGTQRDRIKVYVHSPFNMSIDEYCEAALRFRSEGFHAFKIHPTITWSEPPVGRPDEDIAIYKAVREELGDEFVLMPDNYNTYDYETAVRVGKVLEQLHYKWYESPMPETGDWIDHYLQLKQEVNLPICGPECAPGSYQERVKWIRAGACDITRIDIYMGGFTPCLRLAAESFKAGLPLELHTFGEFYHLQLQGAATDAEIEYMESGTTRRDELLHAESSSALEEFCAPGRLTPMPRADHEGFMAIPQTPGMGVEIDWTFIETHASS